MFPHSYVPAFPRPPVPPFDPFALSREELRTRAEAPGWLRPSLPRDDAEIVAFLWLLDYVDPVPVDTRSILWNATHAEGLRALREESARLTENGRLLQVRQFTIYSDGVFRFAGCRGAAFVAGVGFPRGTP